MRNGIFGIEMKGRTNKWTDRFFEVLISFCLSNAYAIYRANHPNALNYAQFTYKVFKSLFNNVWDEGRQARYRMLSEGGQQPDFKSHTVLIFEQGTRSNNEAKRCKRLSCSNCPNTLGG